MIKASFLFVIFELVLVRLFVGKSSCAHGQLSRDEEAESECYPDPHFRTWDNVFYDWHGGCDVVFVKNRYITVHVRTQVTVGYSYITGVAIQVQEATLELYSEPNETYKECLINRKPCVSCSEFDCHVGRYPFLMTRNSTNGTISTSGTNSTSGPFTTVYDLILDDAQFIQVIKYGNSLSVRVHGNGVFFSDTRGMSGRWDAENYPFHLRMENTTTTDPNTLAISWQVGVDSKNDPDPILFDAYPAGLTSCIRPISSQKCIAEDEDTKTCPVCNKSSGLACCPKGEFETCPTQEQVKEACAHIIDDSTRTNCEFDITVTGNVVEWANSPAYTPQPPPVKLPSCDTTASCRKRAGGKCVTGCQATGKIRCSTKYGCALSGDCKCRYAVNTFPFYDPMGMVYTSVLDSLSLDPEFPKFCTSRISSTHTRRMAQAAANYSIQYYKNATFYNPDVVGCLTAEAAYRSLSDIRNVTTIKELGWLLSADDSISSDDVAWFEKFNKAGNRRTKLVRSLLEFENSLLNDNETVVDEVVRSALLTGSAIYRYSYKYWTRVTKTPGNKWYKIDKKRRKKKKRWWVRGVLGAIRGFVLGFQDVGLPGGLLCGALAGAAAGCHG